MTPADTVLDKIFVRAENIVHRKVAGEDLLVPIRGELADMERLFTLNTVGGEAWHLLDGQRPLREVAQMLFDRFDADRQEIEADLVAFMSRLTDAGLAKEVS